MTIPGLSGSFIVLLLGNYVLIMVDAVNVFYQGLSELAHWRFGFFAVAENREMIYILLVFTLGSGIGLVYLSKALHFILNRHRNQLYASILGFIIGTLGVIWPWKKTLFLTDETEKLVLNKVGKPIAVAYQKYWPEPDLGLAMACFLIAFGFGLVFWLEKKGSSLSVSKKTDAQ